MTSKNEINHLKTRLISFQVDAAEGKIYSKKYLALKQRLIKSGAKYYPSKTEYVMHLINKVLKRMENDRFIAGQINKAFNLLDKPNNNDISKILFHISINPTWVGYYNMLTVKRRMKEIRQLPSYDPNKRTQAVRSSTKRA